MITKIDIVKLDDSILKLQNLKSEWDNKNERTLAQAENCGMMVSEMIETRDALSRLQSGFIFLLSNTILYMEQRKDSVETKEEAATELISK